MSSQSHGEQGDLEDGARPAVDAPRVRANRGAAYADAMPIAPAPVPPRRIALVDMSGKGSEGAAEASAGTGTLATSGTPPAAGTPAAGKRGGTGAVSALFADLEDALLAYDRVTAHDAGARHVAPAFVHIDPTSASAPAHAREALSSCDTIIVGYELPEGASGTELSETLAWMIGAATWTETDEGDGSSVSPSTGDGSSISPGARAFAVCALDSPDAGGAEPSFRTLREWCAERGVLWCGGLAVDGGGLVPLVRNEPRMGMLRRPVSERMDQLIGAIRAGLSVAEAAERFGAPKALLTQASRGMIEARCPLPRWLYRAIMRRQMR